MPHLIAFAAAAAFVLSCSSPTAQNPKAAQKEIAPWETVSINGATFRRVAAKPTATQEDFDITISIPVSLSSGELVFADSVYIAGREYRADCSPDRPTPPTPPDPPPGGDDVGNTPETATDLTVSYPPAGSEDPAIWISPVYRLTARDVDYFRLIVDREVYLGVASLGDTDTKGTLFDASGEVLDRNDDGFESGFNFFLFALVEAGTYYVKVEGYNAATTGEYNVGVSISNVTLDAAVAAEGKEAATVYKERMKDEFKP